MVIFDGMRAGTKALKQIDATLPWRSSLEESARDINELESDVKVLMAVLTDRQRNFVLAVLSGSTQRDAYKSAGYKSKASTAVIDTNASMLMSSKKVKAALDVARVYHQLKFGINAMWKRQQLVNLVDHCSKPGTDTWNPTGANKALQLLMQMDGDIIDSKSGGSAQNSNTTIVVNTGVPREYVKKGEVIDAD